MNRGSITGMILALALASMLLTSCRKSEFGVSENTGKSITITAEQAEKDAFFMSGSLEVDDGEQITIKADLKKGSIRVDIVETPDTQSIDEIPDIDGEAIMTASLRTKDGASGTVPAGRYMVRAVCLEKATGTVQVTAEPGSER